MSEGTYLYDEEGEPYAEVIVAEDGSGAVALDFEGNIVGAVDAELNSVDPSEFQVIGDDDAGNVPSHGYDARLDALEQRMSEPPPQWQPQWQQLPQRTTEQQLRAIELQAEDLGRQRGHELTQSEKRALALRAFEYAEAHGGELDLVRAEADLKAQGRSPLIDTSTSQGRGEWAGRRVAEATDGSDPVSGRPAPVEPADSSASARRAAKAINSLHGYTTDDEGNVHDTMEGGME